MMKKQLTWGAVAAFAILALIGCGSGGGDTKTTEATGESKTGDAKLAGSITIDGSSTVQPILEAMAEEFNKANPDVKITIGVSGTGGGFKKFVAGEIDIANASRPIEAEEITKATENKIEFIELPIAFDGLSVVVNPQNTWVDSLTIAELKKVWEPNSKVKTWADVRAGFPAEPIKLYGPGTDSGTFEYFTEAVNGKKKASRTDYQGSADPNVLVQGIAGDKGSLGYFGFAYYEQNTDKLKLVPVDGGKGAIAPSAETIMNNTYQPLSRPLFIYVKKSSADRPEVKAFVNFILGEGSKLVKDAKYIELPATTYTVVQKHWTDGKVGTVFKGVEPGIKIEDILTREQGK
ncbi:MAG: PstS family phosphate ABC transporter substrate-binding protein [Fimbriimonas sp.]